MSIRRTRARCGSVGRRRFLRPAVSLDSVQQYTWTGLDIAEQELKHMTRHRCGRPEAAKGCSCVRDSGMRIACSHVAEALKGSNDMYVHIKSGADGARDPSICSTRIDD